MINLKKFVAIRMGVNNVTPDWFDNHLDLFKAITIPSLEANANSSTYFCILISELAPARSIQKLHSIIDSSSARDSLRILKILPGWNCKSGKQSSVYSIFADYIEEIVPSGEWFIFHNLDSDDGLCSGYFSMVEEFTKEKFSNETPHKFLLQYPQGAAIQLRTHIISEFVEEFGSNVCTFVTNQCKDARLALNGHLQKEEFFNKRKDFESYKVYNEQLNWFRTFHANSNMAARIIIRDQDNFRGNFVLARQPKELTFNQVLESNAFFPKLEKNILEYVSKHQQEKVTPHFFVDIDDSSLLRPLVNIKKRYNTQKKVITQFLDYNDLIKPQYAEYIREVVSKEVSYRAALASVYGITLSEDNLSNVGWVMYIQHIQVKKNFVTLLAYSDENFSYGAIYEKGTVFYEIKSDHLTISQGIYKGRRRKNAIIQAFGGNTQINSCGMLLGLNQPGLNIVVLQRPEDENEALKLVDSFHLESRLTATEATTEGIEEAVPLTVHLNKWFDVDGIQTISIE